MNSSREDYLQAIYRLSQEDGYTTNKKISEYFQISKPSVTVMLRKLNAGGMLQVERHRISLSEKGTEEAQKILSKHRLWEYFLTNILKMKKEHIHKQADLLEHVTTDELRDALNAHLNYPVISPNGNLIYENVIEE